MFDTLMIDSDTPTPVSRLQVGDTIRSFSGFFDVVTITAIDSDTAQGGRRVYNLHYSDGTVSFFTPADSVRYLAGDFRRVEL